MGMEATAEQRLARLELSNRRLKAAMLAMGTLVIAGAILGATSPIPKTIKAERFVLMDTAGNERAELSANDSAAALQFLNRDGSRALILATGSAGNGLFVSDKKGSPRVSMISSDDGTSSLSIMKPGMNNEAFLVKDSPQATVIALRDPSGKERVDLGYTPKGASLAIADANETTRAMVAEQGIATFQKGGQIDWASFGENMTPEERKHVMDLLNSTINPH